MPLKPVWCPWYDRDEIWYEKDKDRKWYRQDKHLSYHMFDTHMITNII